MIDKFDGEYRWLSNFYICEPFTFFNVEFTSVEAAFQAHKSFNQLDRMAIAVMTPSNAKKAGRKLDMRPDWNEIRLGVMQRLIEIKFRQADLREKLLATGDQELVEGNWWNDTYWGVCNGVGENHLCKILMNHRKELRDTPDYSQI